MRSPPFSPRVPEPPFRCYPKGHLEMCCIPPLSTVVCGIGGREVAARSGEHGEVRSSLGERTRGVRQLGEVGASGRGESHPRR